MALASPFLPGPANPELDADTLRGLAEAVRLAAIPVEQGELLSQDSDVARAFVDAVSGGRHAAYLGQVDWCTLLETYLERQEERVLCSVPDMTQRITDDAPWASATVPPLRQSP